MTKADAVRFQNCLYLTQPATWLFKSGETLVVKREQQTLLTIPIHHLIGVVCLAPVNISTEAAALCMEAGVSVNFLTMSGRFKGRIEGPTSGNVLLRQRQWQYVDQGWPDGVRALLLGKLHNARHLLLRANRERAHSQLTRAAEQIHAASQQLQTADAIPAMRGIEGTAANAYFGAFDHMIRARGLRFERRSRRPPHNAVNAMLSFGYSLLCSECVGALEAVGLDPAAGFLHVLRPGRPALALDLMEEFRPARVDRFVLSLLNRGQVRRRDFEHNPNGTVTMKDAFRKTFLEAWQQRKRDTVLHPFLNQQTTWALVIHLQAKLLARALRGDLDTYPPFLLR